MSMGVLLQAVRDHLRANLTFPGGSSYAPQYVDLQPGGQPPATIAHHYFAVDEVSVASVPDKTHLKEIFNLEVTITKSVSHVAKDRRGDLLLSNQIGMDRLERSVIALIHGNQDLRALANSIGGFPTETNGDQYQQPLWYGGRSKTRYESGDWAGLSDENKQFLVRVLPFTGAVRVQKLGSLH